jgi:cobalamin biosynthesis protein CbiD
MKILAGAKRKGWTRQIQSAKALAKCEETQLTITPVEAVAISMQKRGERHLERMAGVSKRGVDHIETMDGFEILNTVDQNRQGSAPRLWHLGRKRRSDAVGG